MSDNTIYAHLKIIQLVLMNVENNENCKLFKRPKINILEKMKMWEIDLYIVPSRQFGPYLVPSGLIGPYIVSTVWFLYSIT